MSKATNDGLTPVAQITEVSGDIYATVDCLAGEIDTEYVFVAVVHGEIYLAEWTDADDAFWHVDGEISEGKAGTWDSASDKFARDLPEDFEVVDVFGPHGRPRLLVSERDD